MGSGGDAVETRIAELKEQRERVYASLAKFLEEASSEWTKSGPPELIRELDRLLELTNALLSQIEHGRRELDDARDDFLEANAEEFVKNYVVKPGSK